MNHDSCVLFGSIGYDVVDNQLDTLTKAFQATTVACARCHDHKIDAVSTKDYHALLGILRSSRSVQHTLDDANVNALAMAELAELKNSIRTELSEIWKRDAAALDVNKLNAILATAGDAVPAELSCRTSLRHRPLTKRTAPSVLQSASLWILSLGQD